MQVSETFYFCRLSKKKQWQAFFQKKFWPLLSTYDRHRQKVTHFEVQTKKSHLLRREQKIHAFWGANGKWCLWSWECLFTWFRDHKISCKMNWHCWFHVISESHECMCEYATASKRCRRQVRSCHHQGRLTMARGFFTHTLWSLVGCVGRCLRVWMCWGE